MQAAKSVLLGKLNNYKFDETKDVKLADSLNNLSKEIEASIVVSGAKNQAEYEAQTKLIAANIAKLASLAKYSAEIGGLTGTKQFSGKINSASSAQELQKNWNELSVNLSKTTPPDALKAEHALLVAQAAKLSAIAKTAADAYAKNDSKVITAQTALHKAELAKVQAYYDLVKKEVRNVQNATKNATKTLQNL